MKIDAYHYREWWEECRKYTETESKLYWKDDRDVEWCYASTDCADEVVVIPRKHEKKTVQSLACPSVSHLEYITEPTVLGDPTKLIVPLEIDKKRVLGISRMAFRGMENLERIEIPEGIEFVGPFAFEDCRRLKDVVLPCSLRLIGDCAFRRCAALVNVEIPRCGANLQFVASGAFEECLKLEELWFPDSLVGLGDSIVSTNHTQISLPVWRNVCPQRCGSFNAREEGGGIKRFFSGLFGG